MAARILVLICLLLALAGCHGPATVQAPPAGGSPHAQAQAANQAFLHQPAFDPWLLTSQDVTSPIPAYYADGRAGVTINGAGRITQEFQAGRYRNGVLQAVPVSLKPASQTMSRGMPRETLDMQHGTFTIAGPGGTRVFGPARAWPSLWKASDIVIAGDPEAQQVTHANVFYLLSSTEPGSRWSIPPMGLSSDVYLGHIFWDADVWMLPALIAQHPADARSIVDYRFRTLPQAERNAAKHGYAGAEYAWESAETGAEEVTGEFAQERHITADVAWAAWQYYLWTGDRGYLAAEGWPILQASARYWTSRVNKGTDGKYHIRGVLSPDETAGVVDDDAYTNAVVQYNLRAAARAARVLGQPGDPRWTAIAAAIFLPFDKARGIPAENDHRLTDRFQAKQADTLLLDYPLNLPFDAATQQKMLAFYSAHTIADGPAMTSSISTVVAARLALGQTSLDAFRDSYRPFERGPWDAFAEKRVSNTVYFLTGMGGCVQSVLYGFAGLRVVEAGEAARGTRLAGDPVASLYADPHLPPGWGGLTIKGIRFRGRTLTLSVGPGDHVTVTSEGAA